MTKRAVMPLIKVGSIIPADKVAELAGRKPDVGEEAMLIGHNGNFWGRVQADGSYVIEREEDGQAQAA